jgi:hypothetical protein
VSLRGESLEKVAFHKFAIKMQSRKKMQFVVCVKNEGYQASLELRKIYETLPDPKAAERGFVRAIDESGEDASSLP